MRHFRRQHGIDLQFLHDHYEKGTFKLSYTPTDRQAADIFTKHCVNAAKWEALLPQIGHHTTTPINKACSAQFRADQMGGASPYVINASDWSPQVAKAARHHVLIEFCCGNNSNMGNAPNADVVVRFTEANDLTKNSNKELLLDVIRDSAKAGKRFTLWGAIPCTGGCSWYNINSSKGRTRKLAGHLRLYRALFKTFSVASKLAVSLGGLVVLEWPVRCAYWRHVPVLRLLRKLNTIKATIHGCMYNMRPPKGDSNLRIRKV